VSEFLDFSLNSIPGLTRQSEPIISGSGDQALDVMEEQPRQIITDIERFPMKPMDPSAPSFVNADTLILGRVRRSPPITCGPVDITYAAERYYMDIRDGYRITSKGRLFAKKAYLRYEQLYKWLKKHAAEVGGIDLFNLTDFWLKDFIHFLHHQKLALNTVCGYTNCVHAMVGNFITDGLPLKELTIRVAPEISEEVYNSEKELEAMLDANYSHDALRIVADIFVLQSYTGFRVGTLQKFLRDPGLYLVNQNDTWFIQIRTNKTGFVVVVPVNSIVMKILERRNYSFEPAYYERYYNTLIKRMAREAGITQLVPYAVTYGNRRKEFQDAKCDLMSSHTGRRNLATNAYLAGILSDYIMWITGHTTREACIRYVRATGMLNAMAMAKLPFFQCDLNIKGAWEAQKK
jgi:hypothetical protein